MDHTASRLGCPRLVFSLASPLGWGDFSLGACIASLEDLSLSIS